MIIVAYIYTAILELSDELMTIGGQLIISGLIIISISNCSTRRQAIDLKFSLFGWDGLVAGGRQSELVQYNHK